MGKQTETGIEWTDYSFNLAWGCQKVSPGCSHCYAETLARRWGHDVWGPAKTTGRRTMSAGYWKAPLAWNAEAGKLGVRRRVFSSSMADVFEDHPTIDAERRKLWTLIRATPSLDWLLLTKRPERIAEHLPHDWGAEGYHNVWLGTSVESQDYVWRAKMLARIPAVVRFLSCEPLLGHVDLAVPTDGHWLDPLVIERLDWVIVGGESGPNARPMQLEWARDLRDQCAAFSTAFLLKQLGGHPNKRGHELAVLDGVRHVAWPAPRTARELVTR